ncbi:hypothetical protein B0A52_04758 [Exophiala mesophila]|uniref:Uncharacterized protein n=1 Tax=Exophiala mesophila TaxID=212818 RepID=A0A438N8Q8_EXOME|nr:hypothetical protein B0A52_04758 [Exophiala mesophila]
MLLKPRKRPAEGHATPNASIDGLSPAKRGRGRPMKHSSDLKPPQHVRIQQESLIHSQQTTQQPDIIPSSQLSPLEALPVELIHQIFFYALETNMARASPHLAAALSKPSIYAALVAFAFFADDGIGPVDRQVFLPAQYVPLPLEDRVRLQEGILRCQWCTLRLLKASVPVISRLVQVQAWHREAKKWAQFPYLDEQKSVCVAKDQPLIFYEVVRLPLDPENRAVMEAHFFAKSFCLPFDQLTPQRLHLESREEDTNTLGDDCFILRIIEWEYEPHPDPKLGRPLIKRPVSARAVLDTRCLPDHILLGRPEWTAPKLELLMLLRQSIRFLPEAQNRIHMSIDALFEGMASAIRTLNTEALLVLVELYFAICYNPPHFTHLIPLELFHLAAQLPRLVSSEMMTLLVRASIGSIPSEDYILTSWALWNKTEHIAVFLLHHMEGAHGDYGLAPDELLFTNGRVAQKVPFKIAGFAFDEFTNEVPYHRQGTPRGNAAFEHQKLAE